MLTEQQLLAVFMALPQEEPLMKEEGVMVRTSLSMKSQLRIPSIYPTLQWRTLPRRPSGSLAAEATLPASHCLQKRGLC